MKVLAAVSLIALLATVSGSLAEDDADVAQRKREQQAVEREYQRALRATQSRTQTQTPKLDPWGNVRAPDKNSK